MELTTLELARIASRHVEYWPDEERENFLNDNNMLFGELVLMEFLRITASPSLITDDDIRSLKKEQ